MSILVFLSRGFITVPSLPFSKCIHYSKKDEDGIRPGSYELLLIIAIPFSLYFYVLGYLSVVLSGFFS